MFVSSLNAQAECSFCGGCGLPNPLRLPGACGDPEFLVAVPRSQNCGGTARAVDTPSSVGAQGREPGRCVSWGPELEANCGMQR